MSKLTHKYLMLFLMALLCGCQQAEPWASGFPAGVEKIAVHPLTHLGPLEQDAFLKLRRQAVEGEPLLKPLLVSAYDPAARGVWSVSEKPTWYGVEGFLFGYTELWKSQHDLGHSLASGWVLNPWLLALPFSCNRYLGMDRNSFSNQEVARWESEWLPQQIELDGPKRTLTYRFRRTRGDAYEQRMAYLAEHQAGTDKFALNMANARDLGLGAYAVLKSQTHNASFDTYDKITENLQNLRTRILRIPNEKKAVALDLEGWDSPTAVFTPQTMPYTISLVMWPKVEGASLDRPALKIVLDCGYK
ncbi:MAG: hypothetical protein U0931_37585 [Vulcanimicrobiota bacterium]